MVGSFRVIVFPGEGQDADEACGHVRAGDRQGGGASGEIPDHLSHPERHWLPPAHAAREMPGGAPARQPRQLLS